MFYHTRSNCVSQSACFSAACIIQWFYRAPTNNTISKKFPINLTSPLIQWEHPFTWFLFHFKPHNHLQGLVLRWRIRTALHSITNYSQQSIWKIHLHPDQQPAAQSSLGIRQTTFHLLFPQKALSQISIGYITSRAHVWHSLQASKAPARLQQLLNHSVCSS